MKPHTARQPVLHKITAWIVCALIALSNGNAYASSPRAAKDPLQTRSQVSIPEAFGRIDETFVAEPGTGLGEQSRPVPKTVIYIQDAHDSLEAQKNIAEIIGHLVEHHGVKTVYEEGYEGPVPTDEYFSFVKNPQLKEKIAYFLMDKLRLGGAEYAHVVQQIRVQGPGYRVQEQHTKTDKEGNSLHLDLPSSFTSDSSFSSISFTGPRTLNPVPSFKLIGADSIKLHLENIKQYQESAKNKPETEKDLESIASEIKRLADQHFPKELKEWMKLKERFDHGQLDLLGYLKRITSLTPSSLIPQQIELLLRASDGKDRQPNHAVKAIDPKILFLEIDRLENAFADHHLKNERDRKIFQHYRSINLLKRLSDIRLSSAEYEALKQGRFSMTLSEKTQSVENFQRDGADASAIIENRHFSTESFASFIMETTGKPIVLSKRWEKNIQNAIRFYEIAEAREQFIEKSLERFIAAPDERLTVIVFGGFHKNRIHDILKSKHLSCITVSPKITSISEVHQQYYRELMSVGRLSFEPSANVRMVPVHREQVRLRPRLEGGVRSASPNARALEVIAHPSAYLLGLPDRVFSPNLKAAIRSEMRNTEQSKRSPLSEISKEESEALREYARKIASQGGEPGMFMLMAATMGLPVLDPETPLDDSPMQMQVFRSGKPLNFASGVLYHGRNNLDEAISTGLFTGDFSLTRVGHQYTTPYGEMQSPGIVLVDTSVFNRYLQEGKATLKFVGDEDPYPKIDVPFPIKDAAELWVSEETLDRYKKVLAEKPNTDSERIFKERLEPLMRAGKIKPVPGLRLQEMNENRLPDMWFSKVGRYIIRRNLLNEIPLVQIVRSEMRSAEPRLDIPIPDELRAKENTLKRLEALTAKSQLDADDFQFVNALLDFFALRPDLFVTAHTRLEAIRERVALLLLLVRHFNETEFSRPMTSEEERRYQEVGARIGEAFFAHQFHHVRRPYFYIQDFKTDDPQRVEESQRLIAEGRDANDALTLINKHLEAFRFHTSARVSAYVVRLLRKYLAAQVSLNERYLEFLKKTGNTETQSVANDYHETIFLSYEMESWDEKGLADFERHVQISNLRSYLEGRIAGIGIESLDQIDRETRDADFNRESIALSRLDMLTLVDNLISNAVEAKKKDSPLTLSVRYEVVAQDDQKDLRFSLSDNGIGMDASTLERVRRGDRFTTKQQGSGRGIPIIFDIVRKTGGTIEVSSEPDQGTTFIISIPVMIREEIFPTAEQDPKFPPRSEMRSKVWPALSEGNDEVLDPFLITSVVAAYQQVREVIRGSYVTALRADPGNRDPSKKTDEDTRLKPVTEMLWNFASTDLDKLRARHFEPEEAQRAYEKAQSISEAFQRAVHPGDHLDKAQSHIEKVLEVLQDLANGKKTLPLQPVDCDEQLLASLRRQQDGNRLLHKLDEVLRKHDPHSGGEDTAGRSELRNAKPQPDFRSEMRETHMSPWEGFLSSYQGEVYYPAGGTDVGTLDRLRLVFPKWQRFVIAENFDPTEIAAPVIRPGSPSSVSSQLADHIRRIYPVLFDRVTVTPGSHNGHDELDVQLHTNPLRSLTSESFLPEKIQDRYVLKDLFELNERFDVVYVQFPGLGGRLAEKDFFWEKIQSQTQRYLVVDHFDTRQPPEHLFKQVGKKQVDDMRWIHIYAPLPPTNAGNASLPGPRSEMRTLFDGLPKLNDVITLYQAVLGDRQVSFWDGKSSQPQQMKWSEALEQWKEKDGLVYADEREAELTASVQQLSDEDFKRRFEMAYRNPRLGLLHSGNNTLPDFVSLTVNQITPPSLWHNFFIVTQDEASIKEMEGNLPDEEIEWKVLVRDLVRRWHFSDQNRAEMRSSSPTPLRVGSEATVQDLKPRDLLRGASADQLSDLARRVSVKLPSYPLNGHVKKDLRYSNSQIKQAIISFLLSENGKNIRRLLEQIYPDTHDISEIDTIHLNTFQEGKFYYVLKGTIRLQNDKEGTFVLMVPQRTHEANDMIKADWENLSELHRAHPGLFPKPLAFGAVQIQKDSEDQKAAPASSIHLLATEWLGDYIELPTNYHGFHAFDINPGGRQQDWISHLRLVENDITRSTVIQRVVELMIEAMDLNPRTGRLSFVREISTVAGDFMIRPDGYGRFDLKWITVRGISENREPIDFMDYLFRGRLFFYGKHRNAIPALEVMKGLRRGLVRKFGEPKGTEIFRQWLEIYKPFLLKHREWLTKLSTHQARDGDVRTLAGLEDYKTWLKVQADEESGYAVNTQFYEREVLGIRYLLGEKEEDEKKYWDPKDQCKNFIADELERTDLALKTVEKAFALLETNVNTQDPDPAGIYFYHAPIWNVDNWRDFDTAKKPQVRVWLVGNTESLEEMKADLISLGYSEQNLQSLPNLETATKEMASGKSPHVVIFQTKVPSWKNPAWETFVESRGRNLMINAGLDAAGTPVDFGQIVKNIEYSLGLLEGLGLPKQGEPGYTPPARSEMRVKTETDKLEANYVVSMDTSVFKALSNAQRSELYKLFTARSEIRFVFNGDGKAESTPALDELRGFDQRHQNVEIRSTPSAAGFQGRKVIHVTKEGLPSGLAPDLEAKRRGAKDFYPVRYPKSNDEPGLLTAALLLLDAGKEGLLRQHPYFSEVPAALRSEIRQFLESYVYISRSA